jgi:cbb3-type cytochrome oxidase subunit 3
MSGNMTAGLMVLAILAVFWFAWWFEGKGRNDDERR